MTEIITDLKLKSSTAFTIRSTCDYDVCPVLTCGFCYKRFDAPYAYCVAAQERDGDPLEPICKDCC